ncbi:retrotransposon protein, putative, ty1-copia subclass [Tanacetum coccineum]
MCLYLKNQGRIQAERSGFDFPQNSITKNDKIKASGFVQKQPDEGEKENKNDDSQQQAGSSKKRSREDSDEDNAKKQKLEDDAEKEELRDSMDVVPRDDIAIDVESLATKYPIVDWKTHVLTENMMYYQIIRADGSSKNYKIFSEMLDDFDRQDVMDLHRLVQERKMKYGRNQRDYNLISWRLFDSCGIHILLMHTGIAIHMMIEKKYPLTQEMLSRMLRRRLEVDQESEMAFELLSIIQVSAAKELKIYYLGLTETFKVFKNGVENQLGKTIKALRSDRGGEYISQEFKDYLKACGIVQQLTPQLHHNTIACLKGESSLLGFGSIYDEILLLRYAGFFEKSLITQEVSGRAIDLEEIQNVDTSPSKITSEIPIEVEGFKPPQEEVIPIHRSERTHRAPTRLGLNVEAEEHSLGDLNEPTSCKVAMLDPESNK